jgi:hypothetical protein
VLADRIGLRCALVSSAYARGGHSHHAWVCVRGAGGASHLVDLLHAIGQLYKEVRAAPRPPRARARAPGRPLPVLLRLAGASVRSDRATDGRPIRPARRPAPQGSVEAERYKLAGAARFASLASNAQAWTIGGDIPVGRGGSAAVGAVASK